MSEPDLAALRHHGDAELRPGALDFAVNVRVAEPPARIRDRLAARLRDLAAYPTARDVDRARGSVAALHGVDPHRVLPLAGSAEAFHLVARLAARRGLRAAVVHPSFTEPELELRRAGVPVDRVVLPPPYALDPASVPPAAELVVLGNPTNPTSVAHPRERVAELCRPGRLTVVDEAFCDVVDAPAEHTLAGADLPGLLVLRSLTKTWGLAGLRVGYALGAPELLDELADMRPHWPLGTLQLEALVACTEAAAGPELDAIRADTRAERTAMVAALGRGGVEVVVSPAAPFVLVGTPPGLDPAAFRSGLLEHGVAARRCDTFPGLDATRLRLAVRDGTMVDELVRVWRSVADHTPRA